MRKLISARGQADAVIKSSQGKSENEITFTSLYVKMLKHATNICCDTIKTYYRHRFGYITFRLAYYLFMIQYCIEK